MASYEWSCTASRTQSSLEHDRCLCWRTTPNWGCSKFILWNTSLNFINEYILAVRWSHSLDTHRLHRIFIKRRWPHRSSVTFRTCTYTHLSTQSIFPAPRFPIFVFHSITGKCRPALLCSSYCCVLKYEITFRRLATVAEHPLVYQWTARRHTCSRPGNRLQCAPRHSRFHVSTGRQLRNPLPN